MASPSHGQSSPFGGENPGLFAVPNPQMRNPGEIYNIIQDNMLQWQFNTPVYQQFGLGTFFSPVFNPMLFSPYHQYQPFRTFNTDSVLYHGFAPGFYQEPPSLLQQQPQQQVSSYVDESAVMSSDDKVDELVKASPSISASNEVSILRTSPLQENPALAPKAPRAMLEKSPLKSEEGDLDVAKAQSIDDQPTWKEKLVKMVEDRSKANLQGSTAMLKAEPETPTNPKAPLTAPELIASGHKSLNPASALPLGPCYACGCYDHWFMDCKRECAHCQGEGHSTKDCPKIRLNRQLNAPGQGLHTPSSESNATRCHAGTKPLLNQRIDSGNAQANRVGVLWLTRGSKASLPGRSRKRIQKKVRLPYRGRVQTISPERA